MNTNTHKITLAIMTIGMLTGTGAMADMKKDLGMSMKDKPAQEDKMMSGNKQNFMEKPMTDKDQMKINPDQSMDMSGSKPMLDSGGKATDKMEQMHGMKEHYKRMWSQKFNAQRGDGWTYPLL